VVLEQVREAQAAPPSQKNPRVPPELDRIVLRALARDVSQRYAHAAEVAEDLRRFLAVHGGGFSRRELGEYMRAAFAQEIQQEQERLRSFTVPTPPLPLGEGKGEGQPLHTAPPTPLPLGEGKGEGSGPATAPPVQAAPRRHSLRRRALAAVLSLAALAGAGAAGHALRREPAHGLVLLDVPAELRGLARVNVNGEDLGAPTAWPLLHRVAAGVVVLRVSAPGREPFTASVQVAEAPALTPVNAEPQARAPQVPLVVRTEPADAELLLDGRVVRAAGEARVYVGALAAGATVQLEVRAPGYRPHLQHLQPVAGEPLQLHARLQSEAVAGEQFP
jgi:eukaryotic-like serine/threonine-protein kinase